MMEYSDRHCRYLWRLISKNAWVYTEMVVSGAILHGNRPRFLDFHRKEHPIALQIGGSNPQELAECAKIAEQWGYDEVNLNCGCPSDRVQNNQIGAILMRDPALVAECVAAMKAACDIPVTVKHRIGVDELDQFEHMAKFVETVADGGCETFIVHARKAWLQGLSPKENREVPPLNYPAVYELKQLFPQLEIILNGGLCSLEDCQESLKHVDGVMVGREAYSNPFLLREVDEKLYQSPKRHLTREEVFACYLDYCREEVEQGTKIHHLSKHVLGLFNGLPGARQFRRYISENVHKPGASVETLWQAFGLLGQHEQRQARSAK